MNSDIKKSKTPCPSCNMSINNKNVRAVFARCKNCNKVTCDKCRIDVLCIDCHIKQNSVFNMTEYFKSKYLQEVSV